MNEPSVAEVAPGRLLMVMRSTLGRLYQAWSTDNGDTWTRPQPMSLASTEAPAQIRKLPTGHLLIVWNRKARGAEVNEGYNRTRLSSAVSRNGGSVWKLFRNISNLSCPALGSSRDRSMRSGPLSSITNRGRPLPSASPKTWATATATAAAATPSVFVMKDRVLVATTYSTYEQDPMKAQLNLSSTQPGVITRSSRFCR